MIVLASIEEVLVSNYGPIAFGLVSVLVLWKVIVGPSLEKNRVDVTAIKAVADQMHAIAMTTKSTVDRLEAIALRLENHHTTNSKRAV